MEMIITLGPQAAGTNTIISVAGQTLTYNGTAYDLSSIPLNGEAEGEYPAIGTIKNIQGVIHITLLYPYNSAVAEAIQSTDINDYILNVEAGSVPSPIALKPEPVELQHD
jgi:hypothetical protein